MESHKKVDLSFLVGRQVQGLKIFRWNGYFILDNNGSDATVAFDAGLMFTNTDGVTVELDDLQTKGGILTTLLELFIEKADSYSPDPKYDDYQLKLTFTGGIIVKILCCAFVDVNDEPVFPLGSKIIKSASGENKKDSLKHLPNN